jgi:hypothetical protein
VRCKDKTKSWRKDIALTLANGQEGRAPSNGETKPSNPGGKFGHSPSSPPKLCIGKTLVKGAVQSVSNSFLCFLKNKESKKLILCLCIKSRSCTFTTFK